MQKFLIDTTDTHGDNDSDDYTDELELSGLSEDVIQEIVNDHIDMEFFRRILSHTRWIKFYISHPDPDSPDEVIHTERSFYVRAKVYDEDGTLMFQEEA